MPCRLNSFGGRCEGSDIVSKRRLHEARGKFGLRGRGGYGRFDFQRVHVRQHCMSARMVPVEGGRHRRVVVVEGEAAKAIRVRCGNAQELERRQAEASRRAKWLRCRARWCTVREQVHVCHCHLRAHEVIRAAGQQGGGGALVDQPGS